MTGHVAVLGDGSMGTTLAETVARGGRRAVLWCRSEAVARAVRDDRRNPHHFPTLPLSPALDATADLPEAVEGAALVIVAVGSPRVREVARALAAAGARTAPILSSTKGIDLSTLQRMSEVIVEEAGAPAVGTISGPNVTPDVMRRQLTALVVASPDPATIEAGRRALETPRVKVYGSADLAGVESAGVLKNAIAIAMGIATGLDSGSNARSFLFTRGLAEIRALGLALGAAPATYYGLAGVGDLFLTSTSPDSLNYRVGIELASGRPLADIVAGMPEVPEGVNSTRGCSALARRAGVVLPVAEQTRRILDGEAPAASLEDALAGPDFLGIDTDALR